MTPTRLGAVEYLNARPLVHGLDSDPRFDVRFDVPSQCAVLLHAGALDLGLIPSIEYFGGDYRVVPGIGIVSDGPVASVALYARGPIERARSIALDTSSRTSAALTRILCHDVFRIAPSFEVMGPDADVMLDQCDAALLIGDVALFLDHERQGLAKIDLGEAWTRHTGLPFVWAFWAGRPGAIAPDRVDALRHARDRGVAASDAVARDYCGDDEGRVALAQRYLREHIRFTLGAREHQGLERYYADARRLGLISDVRPVRLY